MQEQDQKQSLVQYNQLADRREAAYLAFSKMFALQNPPPDKPRLPLDDAITIVQLIILLVATVIVSASRTFSEFGEVGGAAVIMLELGVISYAFIRTSLFHSPKQNKSLKRQIHFGMALAFIVLLAANIDKVMRGAGVDMSQDIKTVFNLLLAVSAPTLAFITGDLLGYYITKGIRLWKKEKEKFDQAKERWRGDLNEAFKIYAPRLNATIKVEKEASAVQQHEIDLNLIKNSQISQRNKPSPKLKKAVEWLRENPQHLETPPRELEGEIGASYGTIFTAQKMLKSGQFSANGHHEMTSNGSIER